MSSAVVCAIAKEEDLYIEEWVQYHLKLGFDAIYVFDNSEAGTLASLPAKYPGKVHVHHVPMHPLQFAVYNTFAEQHVASHTWCAFIDVDEFIVLKKHRCIKSFLREHCDSGAVCLNWYMFGSSGEQTYRAEPVTKRFVRRAREANHHVKCIARLCDRPRFVFDPHNPYLGSGAATRDTSGKLVQGPFNPGGPTDVACIHHYYTKSYAEFCKKIERGTADSHLKYTVSMFWDNDHNDVEDKSSWLFFNS